MKLIIWQTPIEWSWMMHFLQWNFDDEIRGSFETSINYWFTHLIRLNLCSLESPCNPLSDMTPLVQFSNMMAAHDVSEKLVWISSSKFHFKKMHHLTSFTWRLINNRFHAKSNSLFERGELQLLHDRMPTWLNAILIFYDFCPTRRTYFTTLKNNTAYLCVTWTEFNKNLHTDMVTSIVYLYQISD